MNRDWKDMRMMDVAKKIRTAGMALAAAAAMWMVPGPGAAQVVGDKIIANTQEGQGKPVQIEADSMEVKQEDKQAVFTGNVDAVKGNVHMTSDNLVVDYEDVPSGEGKKTKVTFLNARGSVVVVSKGQTVKAQWAKMDVKANTVVMGDKVTVIDGKSVIQGKRLEMDLTTGKSKLIGGRVRGTFFQ